MTILKTFDGLDVQEFEVSCDACDFVAHYEVGFGWNELMDKTRSDGWKSMLIKGDWEHHCPQCVKGGVYDDFDEV